MGIDVAREFFLMSPKMAGIVRDAISSFQGEEAKDEEPKDGVKAVLQEVDYEKSEHVTESYLLKMGMTCSASQKVDITNKRTANILTFSNILLKESEMQQGQSTDLDDENDPVELFRSGSMILKNLVEQTTDGCCFFHGY